MKKSYLFPNFVLPLFGALAVMCAGSCSQEILESEEVIPDGQTRASRFEISLTVDPAVAGPGNEYYAQNRDYNFQAVYDKQYLDLMEGEITVRAIEGNDDAVKIVSRTDDRATIRFKAPGVYVVRAELQLAERFTGPGLHPVLMREAELICRVVSFTEKIDGPSAVVLGGEYSFKLSFTNPDYPDPILKITESVFNDPKYTILSNDGAGNYRIRFDQPGDYRIEPGVGWDKPAESLKVKYSPSYHVKVFFRPEMELDCIGQQEIGETDVTYLNRIYLYDTQHHIYSNLPFRLYFKYEKIFPFVLDEEYEFVSGVKGEVRLNSGELLLFAKLPETDTYMNGLYYEGTSPSVLGDYWKITIPRDACYLNTCYAQTGGPIVADPDEPIIVAPKGR